MGARGAEPQLTWASERHLRIQFGADPNTDVHDCVSESLYRIHRARLPGLVDITPAAETLLLEFDVALLGEQSAVESVRQALCETTVAPSSLISTLIEIPICYEPSFAPDAADVARLHGITPDELIRIHTSAEYLVQFIGFVPGFGYLSGLPSRLNTPRLVTPRTRVPAGSVGIAADQTGVYPGNTAGGWRLIGQTPLRMFDPDRAQPSLLARGNRVRFLPISLTEFNALARQAER